MFVLRKMTALKKGFSIKCPRCVQGVLTGDDFCQHCGYSLGEADSHFGAGPVAVERFTDAEGLFSSRQREEIGAVQREFERRFPQLFLMIYAGALPPPASPRQFGFWLLNQAAIPSLDVLRPNEKGLLLLVDPAAGSATLMAGYFLECYLSQDSLNDILEAGRKAFGKGEVVRGIQLIAERLTTRLCQVAREAVKHPEAFSAGETAVAADGTFPGLVRLKTSGEGVSGSGRSPSSLSGTETETELKTETGAVPVAESGPNSKPVPGEQEIGSPAESLKPEMGVVTLEADTPDCERRISE
jgi:hypothetical protein